MSATRNGFLGVVVAVSINIVLDGCTDFSTPMRLVFAIGIAAIITTALAMGIERRNQRQHDQKLERQASGDPGPASGSR